MSVITAIRNNYGKYIARGIGAVTLGLVARDAHYFGKIKADMEMKTKSANAADYYLHNTMDLDKPSKTKSDLQNFVFKYELDNNFRGFVNAGVGYVKGLFSGITHDIVPLALGTTALLAKSKTLFKGSAIGLAAYGVYAIIKDGLGWGKHNPSKLTH